MDAPNGPSTGAMDGDVDLNPIIRRSRNLGSWSRDSLRNAIAPIPVPGERAMVQRSFTWKINQGNGIAHGCATTPFGPGGCGRTESASRDPDTNVKPVLRSRWILWSRDSLR